MFQVYVTSPNPTYPDAHGKEVIRDNLDSAIRYAFMRIGEVSADCSVWIETETGEKLALMN